MLRPNSLIVASSWMFIWIPPSPAMTQTGSSGYAKATPIAAGSAKPIVPRPPLVMWLLALVNSKNWAAHIWCCPTSVTSRRSGPAAAFIASITRMGPYSSRADSLRRLSGSWLLASSSRHCLHPSPPSGALSRCPRIERMAAFASAAIPTVGFMTLPSSEGSTSMWMIFARGANLWAAPVILSSKRIPTANRRSERSMARLTLACPCIPGQPRYSGWSSGKALMPSSVVTTGMPVLSASSLSSISAPPSVTPCPARIRGRFAQTRVAVVVGGPELHVLGHVTEDGSWPAAAGDLEGPPHRRVELVGIFDQEGVLGERQRHAHHVRLLEGVLAHRRPSDLARDRHQRYGIHLGRGQPCHQVGSPWTARGHAHPDPARRPGVPVCRVGRGLFVAG